MKKIILAAVLAISFSGVVSAEDHAAAPAATVKCTVTTDGKEEVKEVKDEAECTKLGGKVVAAEPTK